MQTLSIEYEAAQQTIAALPAKDCKFSNQMTRVAKLQTRRLNTHMLLNFMKAWS